MSDDYNMPKLTDEELSGFSDNIVDCFKFSAVCERHFLSALRAFALENAEQFVHFLYNSQIYKDKSEASKTALTIMDWLSYKCCAETEWDPTKNN